MTTAYVKHQSKSKLFQTHVTENHFVQKSKAYYEL